MGITAPYRAQVELIQRVINLPDILVDTVHKFQGKERLTMIMSTTSDWVTIHEDPENIDFLNNENLINVAVSRAKDKLYLIASKEALEQEGTLINDFARYCRYYLEDSQSISTSVYSIFDLMFNDYSEILEPLKRKIIKISQYDSENIMWALLKKISASNKYGPISICFNYPLRRIVNSDFLDDERDKAFVLNYNSHCDFVLYNQLDKSIRLIIEVDGRQHDDETQRQRDERKDRILRGGGLKLIRI